MTAKDIFEQLQKKPDNTPVEVTVSLSPRDKAILTALGDHYGTDISEVVRMLLRNKAEQMPELNGSISFAMLPHLIAREKQDGDASE